MKFQICILAGGLSSRMGQDKAKIPIGRMTLLGLVRAAATKTGLPVRVIRRDVVERCGPLGGIYTALKSTRAEAVCFLACDMPFVTPDLLEKVMAKLGSRTIAVFAQTEDGAGFPFVLRKTTLPQVEEQLARKRFSLQALAAALEARLFRPTNAERRMLLNINTVQDWENAAESIRELAKKRSA
ncbi:MAG: molybdenum cofactor guanylyltransferase [Verrucomicrobiales bacterium]|nr:molybdenum cofactor guanylyltransferase [Verrucomicrobiales bacterium]